LISNVANSIARLIVPFSEKLKNREKAFYNIVEHLLSLDHKWGIAININ